MISTDVTTRISIRLPPSLQFLYVSHLHYNFYTSFIITTVSISLPLLLRFLLILLLEFLHVSCLRVFSFFFFFSSSYYYYYYYYYHHHYHSSYAKISTRLPRFLHVFHFYTLPITSGNLKFCSNVLGVC
jgi:hypothetical protein